MPVLPEPTPTAPAAGQAIPTDADRDSIRRLFAALDEVAAEQPTAVRVEDPSIPSFKDGPRVGDAPPVRQPDHRIVPAWALGIAVASIGVGAGVTGIGCGAWLVLRGLAAVTLNSVLMVTLPFAGLAMVVTAIGGALKSMGDTHVTNNYNGPVRQENRTTNSRSIWNKTINKP